MRNPLEQFEIVRILELIFLNNNIYIIDIPVYIIIIINVIIIIETNNNLVLLTEKEIISKIKKEMILKIMNNINKKYYKYNISIFIIILISNIVGIITYNKTVTSELIITLTLSITLLISITLKGIYKYKIKILNILIPNNTPVVLLPLLIWIETISYIARSISLGLRLGANMIAGHTLLKIIISFIYNILGVYIVNNIYIEQAGAVLPSDWLKMGKVWSNSEIIPNIRDSIYMNEISGWVGVININGIMKYIIVILPITLLIAILLLEIMVSIIQSVVFITILNIYIKDIE